ncbi:MAG: alpha-L-fucosidase [Eubacteriales bacterium]|nr:alpha-L-fucosidase [Clostridiales bacterium]MDY5835821.1 alpha-L-fucosidase [Eubacteriales bacterium]
MSQQVLSATEPSWFHQARYGLFIHFGLYSLLGGQWQGREIPGLAEWISHYAQIPREAYRDLAKSFDPKDLDPKALAHWAKDQGFRYLCLTAKHHEGFALYHSQVSAFNSVEATSCGRDLVAEFAQACKEAGLVFCLYYSQAQDWDHPDGLEAYRDSGHKNFERYFQEKCLPQVRELLTGYGPIGMVWFDTPLSMTEGQARELRDLVKDLQPSCLINGRIGHGLGDYLTTQDRRLPAQPLHRAWELPATLNSSWGYRASDHNWRTPLEVTRELLTVVSRGGNELLNIGPDGQGRIPEGSKACLEVVGSWLRQAGSAVYGSDTIDNYVYEAPELRFTHRPHHLYIHVLDPASLAGQEIPLPNIANQAVAASWLNHDGPCALRQTSTLEGDSYWGLRVPEKLDPASVVLTADIQTEEAEFLQESLE